MTNFLKNSLKPLLLVLLLGLLGTTNLFSQNTSGGGLRDMGPVLPPHGGSGDQNGTPESVFVEQHVNLAAGVNWFSTNVVITLDDLKAALEEALPNTEITIQGQNNNVKYNPTNHRWTGRLTSYDVTNMYKISVSSACEIILEGVPVNPADYPITISNGANWIGYPLNVSLTPAQAFAGFAQNNDIIQSQLNNSKYNGSRWNGRMTSLDPGQGFIYQSSQSNDRTLVFPTSAK